MAINKQPQSGSNRANKQFDAKTNGKKLPLDLTSNISHNFQENLLMPTTPQASASASSIDPSIENEQWQPKTPWWKRWQLWGILLVLCSGGVGYGATTLLLKLPKTQSCSKVFWPVASASVRLYCAQTAAEDKDVDGLLSAINLVAVLPQNHPLRPEIDRNIDRWATSILEIGEAEFQEGNLKRAIAIAKKVPNNVSAKELVDEKIADWRSIWTQGEETYQKVEDKLRQADWNAAFTWAVRLTDSSNQYWATTKYEQSINNINVAQEESVTLNKAQTQVSSSNIDDLILAIEKADKIKPNSYTYDRATEIIAEAKGKLVTNIERLIEEEDWRKLLQVTARIPRSLKLEERNRDWLILANAGASAQLDTVFGIEEAIEEIQKLDKDSEYYKLGRKLSRRWTLEIDDVGHLAKARELARVGTIANYNKAIDEASSIPNGNPRYSEARREINQWQGKIQTIQDRPILNRARELSYGNNTNAWRRALAEISLINRNSPLYGEAQGYARTWRANIQRVEDRPILDEAESFANVNNYSAAIETAREISSDRALYSEAQNRIAVWQQEIDGQRYYREARDIALEGTPESLARAIRTARQASTNSSVGSQVIRDVNDWAAQILAIARQTSNSSLERAIAIAEQVPSGTTSFTPAQKEIELWQIQLNPPEPEIIPPTFKLDKQRKERE